MGLGSVTNDAQVKRSEMGAANGVATLDTDTRLPQAQVGNHAAIHALGGRDTLAAVLASMPAHFSRSASLAAKTVATAADRYTVGLATSWQRLGCNIGESGFFAAALSDMVLSDPTVWDSTTTNYTVAANRAGRDFSLYACMAAGLAPKLLLSANATYPTGYTAATARKLGGFHCLCADAGGIGGHPLSGYLAGDILPLSVWDLSHRPVCAPEGMVYVAGIGKWVDIYLPSLSGGALASVYGGTISDGSSTVAFDWYLFSEFFGRIGKQLPSQSEFIAFSAGSNQATSIAGASDPIVTGGHLDSSGRRMISSFGCEDCCGAMWQWSIETAGQYEVSADYLGQNTSGSSLTGYGLNVPRRGIVGGNYDSGSYSGSLCSKWNIWPNYCNNTISSRGIADAA